MSLRPADREDMREDHDRTVLVTGCGIISALGTGMENTLESLLGSGSGIAPVCHLSTSHRELPVGEVKLSDAELAARLGVGYPESELRTVLLGITAAREALASARLDENLVRGSAFVSGTTVGGMDKTERHFGTAYESGGASEETRELRFNDCGCSTRLIAAGIGNPRMALTVSTACSSAANAIIMGARLIRGGKADVVVAGGSECLSRFHLNGFNTLMVVDSERCRPFDADRNGINLGEGAAYLVLESGRSARRRGATALAELSGWANTCDAFHQTASSADGEGAFLAMSKALRMASLRPSDIDYVNAHGTGTPNNDASELAAMERVWGSGLPPFSSTKPLTGHTTSASGAIESAICLLAMRHGFIPGNLGFSTPVREGCAPVAATRRGVRLRNVVCNSFGFGGNDSTLIFTLPRNANER